MALPDLISRLEQDATGEARALAERADDEVRAIEADADRVAAEAAAARLAERRSAREAVRRRELADARRRAHGRALEARHARLARVLDRARALASEVAASDEYRRALPGHLDEALAYVEGLRPRVRCQAVFAPLLRPAVARHDGADLVVDDAMGPGVVVEAADGSVLVDNTLEARLIRVAPGMAAAIAKEADGLD